MQSVLGADVHGECIGQPIITRSSSKLPAADADCPAPFLPTATAAEAAFALLGLAVHPKHGNILQAAASVFQRLTPTLLGAGGAGAASKRGAAPLDRRAAALDFVRGLYR